MKKTLAILALSAVALTSVARADITIALFGTTGFTQSYSDFTTNTPSATTYQVIGTDFGASVYGDLPASVTIGNGGQLFFTATLATAVTSNFQFTLIDTASNQRYYQGNFSSFTPTVETTVTLGFDHQDAGFNNNVATVGLITAGSGSTLNLTMKSLVYSAIPEPSTYALIGAGLVLLLSPAIRRKLAVRPCA